MKNRIHSSVSLIFSFLILCPAAGKAQQARVFRGKGVVISYQIFGTGMPLLIINGGPGMNSEGFADLAKKLSGKNQAIIFDQRGTGGSVLPRTDNSTVTMDLMVADMEDLRNELKIQSWIVMGHSFGGMLACYYACKHPGSIRALVLSSSGGIDLELTGYATGNIRNNLTQEQKDSVDYWTARITAGDTSSRAKMARAKSLANAYVFNKSFAPIIANRLTQSNFLINNLVWENMRKIKFDCAKGLSTFTKPVLIIQGKQDIIEERTARRAEKLLKNSRVVLLDRCIHYGWLDRKEAYLQEVEKFLAEQG